MRSKSRVVLGVALSFALLVVAGMTILGSGALDPQRVQRLSHDQAAAVFGAIPGTRGSQPSISGPVRGHFGDAYLVADQEVEALVDVNTGRIASVLWRDSVPTGSTVLIPDAAALSASAAALELLGLERGGSPNVELRDHGSMTEYVVEWMSVDDNGVRVPDYTMVRVNPETGEVFAIIQLVRPHDPAAPPVVERERAVDIARELTGLPVVIEAYLHVQFTDEGVQRTVWRVLLASGTDEAEYITAQYVLIDAATGAVIADQR